MGRVNENGMLDTNGRKVHSFAMEMTNLGFPRMGELLKAMLESGSWKRYKTGLGTHTFLDGEFDYFLTQQGVERDHVMRGVRDVEIKAELEAAMDERRTGEDGYRRRIKQAREEVPAQPGRPLMPFGVTKSEAKVLVREGQSATSRDPLGKSVRQYTLTGGRTTKRPSEEKASPLDRIQRTALKLEDPELDELIKTLQEERKRRKRHLKAVR